MNSVHINTEEVELPDWAEKASGFALKVLDEIKRDNWELSILFCGDKTIKRLNSKFRNKNEPTDILSFNLGETVQIDGKTTFLPGDIVISLKSMQKNAKIFEISENEELQRLIIHGILHLDGMNHETNNGNEPMLTLQEELLVLLDASIFGGGK